MHSLGSALHSLGDLITAEALFRRALEGFEEVVGVEHQNTLTSMIALADLLKQKGDYEGAAATYRRALASKEKAFGVGNPDTINCADSLAKILNRGGRRKDAIELLRRYTALSATAKDHLAYKLACYECLEGNLKDAKRLIGAHLEKYPDKKEKALVDADLARIREWISTLKQQNRS
jgi:tetratricopeptide (TPR) repeat protein